MYDAMYELYGTHACDCCSSFGLLDHEINYLDGLFFCNYCFQDKPRVLEKIRGRKEKIKQEKLEKAKQEELEKAKKEALERVSFPMQRIDEAFALLNGLQVEEEITVGEHVFTKRASLKVETKEDDYQDKMHSPKCVVDVWKSEKTCFIYFSIKASNTAFLQLVRNPELLEDILKDYGVDFIRK